MPSLRSSPWILGAPHNGLATLIWRISWRVSSVAAGRPQRGLDFHRQYDLSRTVPTDPGLRLDNCKCAIHVGKQSADASQYQPVNRAKSKSLRISASQNI